MFRPTGEWYYAKAVIGGPAQGPVFPVVGTANGESYNLFGEDTSACPSDRSPHQDTSNQSYKSLEYPVYNLNNKSQAFVFGFQYVGTASE
jgi:hypothetical protein